jgi:type II secretory pathway pseudopilin PulG
MMRDDEHGFTLIELLITTMVTVIVVGTLAGALILVLTTSASTTERLSESPDLQIAAAYFGSDVQSAKTFPTTVACGPSTPLVAFAWTDPGTAVATSDDSAVVASYVVMTTGTQKHVVRHYCKGSAAPDTTTVVRYVDPATTPVATGACAAPCAAPTTVSLTMQLCTADSAGVCKDDPFPFQVKATTRRST